MQVKLLFVTDQPDRVVWQSKNMAKLQGELLFLG
jgi:hypothetical protein